MKTPQKDDSRWVYFDKPRQWSPDTDNQIPGICYDENYNDTGIVQPGTWLLTEGDEAVLIGHINLSGGRCDCCNRYGLKFVAYIPAEQS